MTAWKTILQHEFLDKNLENFNASEGILQTSNPPPLIESRGSSIDNFLDLRDEQWVKYIPKETIRNVIGIQIKFKVRISHHHINRKLEMFDLGQFKVNMVLHAHNTGKSMEVRYGSHLGTVVNYPADDLNFTEVKILWLPNGQLRTLINGRLVLFQNNFGTGSRTTLESVKIGVNENIMPIRSPEFSINYLHVKVLREFDSAFEILNYFPPAKCPPTIPAECLKKASERQSAITFLIRDFMAQFSQKHTRNWDEMNDNGAPISRVAKQAHAKAIQCGIAFKNAFANPGTETAKEFYDLFKQFLLFLKLHLPELYSEMLEKVCKIADQDPECEEFINAYHAQLDTASKYYLGLFEESMKIILSTK